jgi:hypothetical protein
MLVCPSFTNAFFDSHTLQAQRHLQAIECCHDIYTTQGFFLHVWRRFFTIADVRLNLPSFDGLRTIEHAMRSMLPDRDFTFLNGFELPYIGPSKYQKEVEKEAVNAMNKAFSKFLDQKISSTAEVEVDLSLLLVDFKEFDRSKETPYVRSLTSQTES